jgi:hypothetical protein
MESIESEPAAGTARSNLAPGLAPGRAPLRCRREFRHEPANFKA